MLQNQMSSQGSIGAASSYSQSGVFVDSVQLGPPGQRPPKDEVFYMQKLLASEVLLGEEESKARFFLGMAEVAQNLNLGQITVALHLVSSICGYLDNLDGLASRSSVMQRRIVHEACAGPQISENREMNMLAKALNIDKSCLYRARVTRPEGKESRDLQTMLSRNSPVGGGRIASMEKKLELASWWEDDAVTDIVKGSHAIHKERVRGTFGPFVCQRQKRIIKVPLSGLLPLARSMITWQHSLTTLLRHRPPWILFPSQRSLSVCLCDICHNITLLLRALYQLLKELRRRGGAVSVQLLDYSLSNSTSGLISSVLHPLEDESIGLHRRSCYEGKCDPSQCGIGPFRELFAPLLAASEGMELDVFQHSQVGYLKPDGKEGKKWEMQKNSMAVADTVAVLEEKIFGQRSYLHHLHMKKLCGNARQQILRNLRDDEVFLCTDYSKELEIPMPEATKGYGFGASHKTYQLIPQVWIMVTLTPGPPTEISVSRDDLDFIPPEYDGGGRVTEYQVHLLDVNSNGDWKLYCVVPVRPLSASPNIPPALFQGLKGRFLLRVVARNAAGVGPGNTIMAEFTGDQGWCENILTKLRILFAFSRCIGLRKPSSG